MSITVERIFALVEASGKSEYVIKKETGLKNSMFSEWRAGRANPSTNAIITLAKYFNVSTDYLLGLSDEKQPTISAMTAMQSNTLPFADEELSIIMENNAGLKYFEQIIAQLNLQQKIYALSWLVGYAQSQGIVINI